MSKQKREIDNAFTSDVFLSLAQRGKWGVYEDIDFVCFTRKALADLLDKERAEAVREFAEYCHTHYAGCVQEDGKYMYQYDTETVMIADEYLANPKADKELDKEGE